MCSVEENIKEVQENVKNTVRLVGKREYCNSGLLEYTVQRGTKRRNVFEMESE